VSGTKFKSDREAADFWATHDSAAYIAAWISEALVRELRQERGGIYCPLPAGSQLSTLTR